MLTVTAPGVGHHLLWNPVVVVGGSDTWPRTARLDCDCADSAPDGLSQWNPGASGCWNRLRTALRRDDPELEFFRSAEVQKRGAIHLHVLVRASSPLDVLRTQSLALAAGFGCVIDLASIVPGSRKHAYYVSKYVTKAADSRDQVPWAVPTLDEETGEVRPLHTTATYRTWSASRGWGLTMAAIRVATAAAARAHAAHTRLTPSEVSQVLSDAGLAPVQGPSPP